MSARSQPVRLPSGSVVAGSFAAGVLSAVALGRLRRRHAYRYRPPQPGRDLTPPPLRPTLAHLASATEDAREASGEPVVRRPAAFNAERALEPGRVELGRRDGETIAVEVTDLSGVAISGPAADDVARALLAGMLAGALPGAAEILVDEGVAERLLPGARGNPALRRVPSPADAVRDAEVERVARARRLAAATAPDAPSFRRHNPEHPMPTLLVLVDAPEAEHAPRWASLAAHGPRLGMAVVYLGITEAATGRLACDAERRVTDASPVSLSDRLGGAELFGLGAEEARELLDALTEGLWDEPDHAAAGAGSPLGPEGSERPDGRGEPWPQPPTGEGGDHPLSVRVFGHLTVSVDGAPVADGLRSRAKMLLAFYLLRPEGATGEQAVDALWPETAPDQVGRQFWRAFGDLRTRLREAGGGGLDVLVKTGEHYRPSRAEIGCDLWDFEAALAGAARTEGEEEAAPALRRAVSAYGGELLEGSDWPWVAPAREDLHRRALDAHLRLAELEEASGRPDAAAAVLERAVELAGCAEEPYRRLMAHHACHGHPDALGATWRRLQRHLADLDLEVEPATARLYRALTNAGEEEGSSRPARLSL